MSDYVQFMFHFHKRDSIDARNITNEELEWCREMRHLSSKYEQYYADNLDTFPTTVKTINTMFELHFPEELI